MAERTKLQLAMSNVDVEHAPLSYAEERAGIVEEGHRMLAQAAAEAERIALNQAEAEIEAAAHEQARLLAGDRARAMEAVALTLKAGGHDPTSWPPFAAQTAHNIAQMLTDVRVSPKSDGLPFRRQSAASDIAKGAAVGAIVGGAK